MQEQQSGLIEPGAAWRPTPHLDDMRPENSQPYRQVMPTQRYRTNRAERNEQLAKALGWFSIGLGIAQLLAPRAMSQAVGLGDRPNLMRAVGLREIASGIGILGQRRSTPWLWTRVAGDAMDLSLLGTAARQAPTARDRARAGAATAAVAGIAMLDVLSSTRNTEMPGMSPDQWIATGPVHVEKSVTVNRTPDECYAYWRDFGNFPRFMTHLESVQVIDDKRSHWKAKAPAGSSMEWDAEITVDQPGKLLAWRSLEGAEVDNAGTVTFERATGGRGTVIRIQLQYRPPGGKAGALIAKLFREEPSQQVDEDLRNFKRLIETGEIPTTVGQPSGRRGAMTRLLFRKGAPG
jgi:uncharacterized membrane protein